MVARPSRRSNEPGGRRLRALVRQTESEPVSLAPIPLSAREPALSAPSEPAPANAGPGSLLHLPLDEPTLGDLLLRRNLISKADLMRALVGQARTGAPLGKILIALDLVKRLDVYQALADIWGMPFVDLVKTPVDPELVRLFPCEEMVEHLFVPIRREGDLVEVATAVKPEPALEARIQAVLGPVSIQPFVTTEWDIDRTLRAVFREYLLGRAVLGLYERNPAESAFTVLTVRQYVVLFVMMVGLFASFWFYFQASMIVLNLLVNLGFLASIIFKLIVATAGVAAERNEYVSDEEVAALKDEDLPTYTILVPVFKEAEIVNLLVTNLCSLDYPPEKVEILLLMEENDEETITAARASNPPQMVTFVLIPDGQPKTKPKACNVGLVFSRGEYLVIYDAEDRPEPDQLKKAVVAFRKGPKNLVCVQGALNYFNGPENFLTRMFTLEYSFWFDYILPGLERLKLPIPLGGTSNHFKTSVLRELGGWDPFNVTEDADLGIRASANGYTIGVVNSTTYEEANNATGNWIRQRSRWIKGYMQTTLVHLRNPGKLVKTVGLKNALGFAMLIGGTCLTFLCQPPLWAIYLFWLITRTNAFDPYFVPAIVYLSLFNLLIGNMMMVYLNILAVFKRRYYDLLLFAMCNPAYWMLHSIASYKALWQLFTKPFFWEKTTHGISRHVTGQTPPGAPH